MMQYSGADNLEAMKEAENYNCWLVTMIKKSLPPCTEKVADFGAGNGMFARILQERTGIAVACIEPAENMRAYSAGLQWHQSLAELQDNSLDFAYSLNVLEHIADDRLALRQLYAKIRPGGGLLIYVPAFPCLYSSMDKTVGHFRRYRRAELRQKVQSAGFTVEYCRYADFAGWFASMLFKHLPGQNGRIKPQLVRFYDRFVFPVSLLIDNLGGKRLLGKNLLLLAKK